MTDQERLRFIAKIEQAQARLRLAALHASEESPYNAKHDVLSAIRALRDALREFFPRRSKP